jgi:hypothetical protein
VRDSKRLSAGGESTSGGVEHIHWEYIYRFR